MEENITCTTNDPIERTNLESQTARSQVLKKTVSWWCSVVGAGRLQVLRSVSSFLSTIGLLIYGVSRHDEVAVNLLLSACSRPYMRTLLKRCASLNGCPRSPFLHQSFPDVHSHLQYTPTRISCLGSSLVLTLHQRTGEFLPKLRHHTMLRRTAGDAITNHRSHSAPPTGNLVI